MIVLAIILGVVGLIIGVIYFNHLRSVSKIKKEIVDWQVGDIVNVYFNGEQQLKKLLGWTLDSVFIENEGATHKLDISKVMFNKSAVWRRNYNECKSVMKTEPGFTPVLTKLNGDVYEGKHINTMSEIECQVYLKMALENEEFEIAEKIKKQMEKYR